MALHSHFSLYHKKRMIQIEKLVHQAWSWNKEDVEQSHTKPQIKTETFFGKAL